MNVMQVSKWPFDAEAFKKDVDEVGGPDFELQILQLWNSAWLILIEHNGPISEIRFGDFVYPCDCPDDFDRSNWQSAWNETVLLDEVGTPQFAFFLHCKEMSGALFYGSQRHELPSPSPVTEKQISLISYSAPWWVDGMGQIEMQIS